MEVCERTTMISASCGKNFTFPTRDSDLPQKLYGGRFPATSHRIGLLHVQFIAKIDGRGTHFKRPIAISPGVTFRQLQ